MFNPLSQCSDKVILPLCLSWPDIACTYNLLNNGRFGSSSFFSSLLV